MLEKIYIPRNIEPAVWEKWAKTTAMSCAGGGKRVPFTITMPPPNVTGTLHLGHALTFTLQDILVRYWRMRGRDVLWQPGTDHAGIATQMVVERQLAQEGTSRRTLGRETFLKRVWAWKQQAGDTILQQLQRLGASADWTRTQFTLDEGVSEAVCHVFVTLYEEGLIYRDKRLVNWDPHFKTAISDLEVEHREEAGTLWILRYPLAEDPTLFIEVATSRPETLFGDQAIAVHPEDSRTRHMIGQLVRLPLTDRLIPIIGDVSVDPEKGTGALKITPAHSLNDFEVGKRHGLEPLNILDENACLNTHVPEAFQGLDRFVARTRVLEALQNQGLLRGEIPTIHGIPYGDRSGVVIEPWLTDQWYVNAQVLAEPAIQAVEEGQIRFVPASWAATYFEWMRNIQPWCISRQLWWGHRIPAWYGPDGHVFVARSAEIAQEKANAHYGYAVPLTQDEDVLDTWFSSALWPFSTLGWPHKTPEMSRYYPTDVLVTGFDIIFFWVARMIMMGLHFPKEVPFKTVYIHALLRDEKGQKMSKSKGNVIDPLTLMDQYGADALRLALAALAAPGRDICFGLSHVETYRNFITKLWNATRFCLMKGCIWDEAFDPMGVTLPLNRWMVESLTTIGGQVASLIEQYRFHEAVSTLYHFTWGTYCDWYVELSKFVLEHEDAQARAETQSTAAWALGTLLHFLHPFMPFVSEALWAHVNPHAAGLLISAPWPELPGGAYPESTEEISWLIQLMTYVRTLRAELNIPPKTLLTLYAFSVSPLTQERLERYRPLLCRLLRLTEIQISAQAPSSQIVQGAAQGGVQEAVLVIPLTGIVDINEERKRLSKALEKIKKEARGFEEKLNRPDFVQKAPAAVIEDVRERLLEVQRLQEQLTGALGRVGGLL